MTLQMFPLGAVYCVHVFYFGGEEDFRQFEGERAFTLTNDFFEASAHNPEAFDVWLTRADGAPEGSRFVARSGRRAHGRGLEPIPFAEHFPDPSRKTDD